MEIKGNWGHSKFTYFPKALVEFDVQGGIRPRWGLTDHSQQKYKTQALKGSNCCVRRPVIEMKKLEFTGFHKPPDEHMA